MIDTSRSSAQKAGFSKLVSGSLALVQPQRLPMQQHVQLVMILCCRACHKASWTGTALAVLGTA
jgi:hypothetical protein